MKAVITIDYEFDPNAYDMWQGEPEDGAKIDRELFKYNKTASALVDYARWLDDKDVQYSISAEITT